MLHSVLEGDHTASIVITSMYIKGRNLSVFVCALAHFCGVASAGMCTCVCVHVSAFLGSQRTAYRQIATKQQETTRINLLRVINNLLLLVLHLCTGQASYCARQLLWEFQCTVKSKHWNARPELFIFLLSGLNCLTWIQTLAYMVTFRCVLWLETHRLLHHKCLSLSGAKALCWVGWCVGFATNSCLTLNLQTFVRT